MSKKDRIRRTLTTADRPLSTNEVSDRAEMDWHTAHDHLTTMEQQGEVRREQWHDRLTVWYPA